MLPVSEPHLCQTVHETRTVQGVIDWNASQVCVQVGHGCVLCFHLFILCSHGYNFFNDVGLIFRWLLRDRNTHKPIGFAVPNLSKTPLPSTRQWCNQTHSWVLTTKALVLSHALCLTSACHANAVVLSPAMRPAPRTAIVSPSSSTTLKSKSSLYFLLLTWRPERRF